MFQLTSVSALLLLSQARRGFYVLATMTQLSQAIRAQPALLRLCRCSRSRTRPVLPEKRTRATASASSEVAGSARSETPLPIVLTDSALNHLQKLRAEHSSAGTLCLRVGVKQGGCSGLSYTMDFEDAKSISEENDAVIEYEGFTIICDTKSLLYLYGLSLDYSDSLIGGGFKFVNPNADSTCGCGSSFSA